MKKGVIISSLLFYFFLSFVSAADTCNLAVSLLNQDPDPAVPSEYVEVVFQVSGVEAPECQGASFEFINNYPFTVQGSSVQTLEGSTYLYGYKSSWTIPYKILVDKDAIDGETEIEVRYWAKNSLSSTTKKFNISVEDTRADFEVYVKDYSYQTSEITIEILNTGDTDIEALTIEIPKQNNIQVKGSNREILGDLDSNEFTSADFEATPQDGTIVLNIIYTDQIGIRRDLTKNVEFDSSYFTSRASDQTGTSSWYYILGILIVIGVGWFFRRRSKKKKEKERALARQQAHRHDKRGKAEL